MNFRDSPQLKDTASNSKRKDRLEDNSDKPAKFKRRNRLEDYSLKRVLDSKGNLITERALAFKKFKAMQDTLRDDLLDFDIDEEETDAFLKKIRPGIKTHFNAQRVPLDKNNINTLQKEFIGNIANKESLGNDLGVQMLGETVWGMKSKQDRENMLDNLDEEMVLDMADSREEGFRNIFNLRKYKQSKANAESIKQNAKRFLSNQNINFLKFN